MRSIENKWDMAKQDQLSKKPHRIKILILNTSNKTCLKIYQNLKKIKIMKITSSKCKGKMLEDREPKSSQ
jgi:hypothetical protein